MNIVANVDADLGLDSYLNIKSTQNITNAKPLDNKQKKSQPLRIISFVLQSMQIWSTQNITNAKPLDNKQKKSQPLRYRSQSVDYESVGGIFDIDVDVDEGNAFDSISYSDEEDDDSIAFRNTNNDYNYNNGRAVPNAQINAQTHGLMAYSLPIQVQVPKWKTFYNHKHDIDEEDVPMIRNDETIAESIKKLAKSVRNESDIFGDRPRRRLNTGDLIKSRPI
ncbi:unnamed protein product [Oppiella nova]|uniref:Uncharacterized protein n=1 Tax=Oppiella nova TaxID=334625 RepID=A0A7R9MAM2_9ACAR|nr:unnamed protein product [Oppiella nova]CAG2173355.1 unnamed protein product [Oppiella nova]